MMAGFGRGQWRGTRQDAMTAARASTTMPKGVPESVPGAAPALPTYSPDTAPAWLSAVSVLPEVLAYKAHSYELLNLKPGMTLLDVGCGVGNDAHALAPLLAPGGRVIAVDDDPQMIAAAQARQAAAALAAAQIVPIQFVCAPAERLPTGDASVDVVRVDRVLQHVRSPQRVMEEIRRVLRPGGRVVAVEPDWRTIAVYPAGVGDDDDDTALAAVLRHAAGSVAHPLIGRRLRSLLCDAGYEQVTVEPVAYGTSRFEVADLGLELSATVGAIGAADPVAGAAARAWLMAARAAAASGQFFACVPLIFACAVARA